MSSVALVVEVDGGVDLPDRYTVRCVGCGRTFALDAARRQMAVKVLEQEGHGVECAHAKDRVAVPLAALETVIGYARLGLDHAVDVDGEVTEAERVALAEVEALAVFAERVEALQVRSLGPIPVSGVVVLDAGSAPADEEFVEELMDDLRRAAGHDRFTVVVASNSDGARLMEREDVKEPRGYDPERDDFADPVDTPADYEGDRYG